jgi:predicted ABC-type transport system involved in lysophospholipase L1 biosynthesis ATPase subunit
VPVRAQLQHTARHHRRSNILVEEFLAKLGLEGRADALPHQLSGGERRRAALARSLLPNPLVLFADEPTSGLDAERRHDVLTQVLAVPPGGARVVVGHDLPALAARCDRLIVVVAGRVVADVEAAALRDGRYRATDPAFAALLDASGYVPT